MLYFIIGYPYCGKSTLGEKLKEKGICVIDLDSFIEKETGKSIDDIFKIRGEKSFREEEKKYLHEIVDSVKYSAVDVDTVIICGGGTPTYEDNLIYMKSFGLVIYLQVSFKTIWNRFLESERTRPRFDSLEYSKYNSIPLMDYMEKDLKEREEKFYKKAHIIINYEEGIDTEWPKFKSIREKRTRNLRRTIF